MKLSTFKKKLLNNNNLDNFEIIYSLVFKYNFTIFLTKINTESEFEIVLHNLDEFINFYNTNFSIVNNKIKYLYLILDYSFPFFLFKKNSNELDYKEFFVSNCYNNMKFIYDEYSNFFSSIHIKKNINVIDGEELDKLFSFLVYIIWSNFNRYELIYIFSNYKNNINELKHYYSKKGIYCDCSNIYKNIYHKYCDYWSILLNNYNKCKSLLNVLFKLNQYKS